MPARMILITAFMHLMILSGTTMTASAARFEMLKETPTAKFSEEDWALLRKTAREALENGKDGIKAAWDNPNTGNSGSITPLNTMKRESGVCRKTRFFNSAEGLTAIQIHVLCKQPDGKWKIAPR